MNHLERATLIKRLFILGLAGAIGGGVYFFPMPKVKTGSENDKTKPMEAGNSEKRLLVVHHHLPGNPTSEQIADILNLVDKKYEKYLTVNRVDFKRTPETAKAHGVTKPPHVIVFSGTDKIYEFQGPATQIQVERKIEEILRGLKRIDKNWRPPVPGMKPVAS